MVESVTIYVDAGEVVEVINTSVTPPPAPAITNLTATPASLPAGGGPVKIDATVNHAITVQIDGANVTLPHTVVVTTTSTFTLTASGQTAPPAQAQVTVTVAGGTTTPPPPGALTVTLDDGAGAIARYDQATAIDKGDFVGEFVRQKCLRAIDPAFPDLCVDFRPDMDGLRDEVVVWLGRTTAGVVSNRLTPYTATVAKNGAVVHTVTVPRHFGFARWRWASSERPVVRTSAMLKARGWLPNFGTGGLFGRPPTTFAVPWNGPMSAPSGFDPVMGNAGDNPQIGYLTQAAAEYVIHGTPQSLTTARTEAEWMGNWCIHRRDDVTGAPLDVRGKALATKSNGGTIAESPTLPISTPGFVAVDVSHRYPCANLPWMLTDDPYYLEELQFSCNDHLLTAQYHRSLQKLQGLVYPGETRAFAWGLRDLFLAALTTPAVVPSWLLPRSYFQACVDDNKAYALKFVNSPARIHAKFRVWTRSDWDPAWQTAWLNAVVGIAVGMGFTDWLPIFQWGIDKHIQMTNGTSGWSRQWPAPYYSFPNRGSKKDVPSNYFSTTAPDATTCVDWADYWAYFKSGSPDVAGTHQNSAINDAGWDGHTLMQSQSGPSYYLHLLSVLAVAVTRGIPGAQACYDYLQAELAARPGMVGQAAFSVVP